MVKVNCLVGVARQLSPIFFFFFQSFQEKIRVEVQVRTTAGTLNNN